jgi:glycine dehydrogenase subunit 1
MDYTPHTEEDIRAMLREIGVSDISQLFGAIPEGLQLNRPLSIPPPMAESEVFDLVAGLSRRNRSGEDLRCFAGGGAYDHYVPAPVRHLAYRAEFATSYTPYQPELSQGVLGALFEFQTMVCELTGMEASNASVYDGASAMVEAINLSASATGRKKIVISEAVNPNYRKVAETFGAGLEYEFVIAPAPDGTTAISDLGPDLGEAACLVVGYPNFFGCIEDLAELEREAHSAGSLLVVVFDPLAAGVLEPPGALGADVVVGEGQSLGNDLNYGGPYLGLFATKMEYVRRMPGRITGATVDVNGKPGFVLTLQAREQHIRREKANSNICTNQTLMAIVATVYLSWLGPKGLLELGETCVVRSHQTAELLSSVPGCFQAFDAPFFKEFVLRVPKPADTVVKELAELGYLVGPALGHWYPDLADSLLVAVTERRSPEEVEGLAKALAEVVA